MLATLPIGDQIAWAFAIVMVCAMFIYAAYKVAMAHPPKEPPEKSDDPK